MVNNAEAAECGEVTGFVLPGLSPDAYITVFGCVEELRAFPERMLLHNRALTEHLAFARIMKLRNLLQQVRWIANGRGMIVLALNGDTLETSEERLALADTLSKVAKALDDFEACVPVTWGVERDALSVMMDQLLRTYMATVPADEIGKKI
jgi:hypothetical protein